jgi:hypothetical protein
MKSKRPFGAVRRLVATSVAVLTVGIGLVTGTPAAHAGSFCGWTGGWAPMTLLYGWHSAQSAYNTGDPSYCMEADGMVYLSGSITAPSGTPSTFGRLPSTVWPAHVLYLDVYTVNGTYGILRIDHSGYMEVMDRTATIGSAEGYTSLAGVSFPAAGVQQTGIMPLLNGWQSAQGTYNTGDPSYSVSNGIVHLSGSLRRPAGTPSDSFPFGAWAAATLPTSALPSDNCFLPLAYTYAGGIMTLPVDSGSGTLYGANAQYTSLAGISYPPAPTAWQPLTLLNGSGPLSWCNTAPSYFISGNVVYLTGTMAVPAGSNGEIAVLPPAARPTHELYMIVNNYYGSSESPASYLTLRIDPSGAMWIFNPSGDSFVLPILAGLSFHTLS